MSSGTGKLIIKGITEDGRRFRPSDWAQRLATAVGGVSSDRRIVFHPKVRIATLEEVTAVIVDEGLAEEDPSLYEFLLGFARNNKLQIEHRD